MATIQKITPFLWFEDQGQEAAEYYVGIFPEAKILSANPFVTMFELFGQRFATLNGSSNNTFNDSVSFSIDCKDQAEVDYYWDKLTADGGKESQCGWLKDKYGVAWQVIPSALGEFIGHPNQEKAGKAVQAMLKMRKIIIADLEKAFNS